MYFCPSIFENFRMVCPVAIGLPIVPILIGHSYIRWYDSFLFLILFWNHDFHNIFCSSFFSVRDRFCERLREWQINFCENIIELYFLAGKQMLVNFESWSSLTHTCWQKSVLIKPSGIQEIKKTSSKICWNECQKIRASGRRKLCCYVLWSSGKICTFYFTFWHNCQKCQ